MQYVLQGPVKRLLLKLQSGRNLENKILRCLYGRTEVGLAALPILQVAQGDTENPAMP